MKQYQEPADIEDILKERSVIEWNLSNLEKEDLDIPEAIHENTLQMDRLCGKKVASTNTSSEELASPLKSLHSGGMPREQLNETSILSQKQEEDSKTEAEALNEESSSLGKEGALAKVVQGFDTSFNSLAEYISD